MSFYLRWAISTCLGLYQTRPFCADWDRVLSDLLDRHEEGAVMRCLHVIDLGGVEVWVSCEYWGYGYRHSALSRQFRPSIKTMRRLDAVVRRERPKEQARRREFFLRTMKTGVVK